MMSLIKTLVTSENNRVANWIKTQLGRSLLWEDFPHFPQLVLCGIQKEERPFASVRPYTRLPHSVMGSLQTLSCRNSRLGWKQISDRKERKQNETVWKLRSAPAQPVVAFVRRPACMSVHSPPALLHKCARLWWTQKHDFRLGDLSPNHWQHLWFYSYYLVGVIL